MEDKKKPWIPEITYETDDDGSQLGDLPLIHVPRGEVMPKFLMLWEARSTGEFEPGQLGEDVPVVEWDLRQYAQMDVLRQGLSPEEYDKVRAALGLQPLAEATKKGKAITQKIRGAVASLEMQASGKKF